MACGGPGARTVLGRRSPEGHWTQPGRMIRGRDRDIRSSSQPGRTSGGPSSLCSLSKPRTDGRQREFRCVGVTPRLSLRVPVPAAAALLAAYAVCGSSDGSGPYVGRASNAVVYVSWTRSDDNLTGALTQALRDDDVHEVKTDRVSFTDLPGADTVPERLGEARRPARWHATAS